MTHESLPSLPALYICLQVYIRVSVTLHDKTDVYSYIGMKITPPKRDVSKVIHPQKKCKMRGEDM